MRLSLGILGLLLIPLQGQVPTLIPPPWNGTTIYPFFFFFVGGSNALPAGLEQWSDFAGQSQNNVAPSNGAGYSQVLVPTVFDHFTMSIQSVQPVSGTLVCSLYSGTDGTGADTALTVTFAAGAARGTIMQDLTHSYSAAVNDKLSVHCINNAAASSAIAGTLSIRVH